LILTTEELVFSQVSIIYNIIYIGKKYLKSTKEISHSENFAILY